MKQVKVKPMKAWVVVDSDSGSILAGSCHTYQYMAREMALDVLRFQNWKKAYGAGYRVIRVEIKPTTAKED